MQVSISQDVIGARIRGTIPLTVTSMQVYAPEDMACELGIDVMLPVCEFVS